MRWPCRHGAVRRGIALLAASSLAAASSGCLESPLSPSPAPGAALVRLVVSCGRWTTAGATCTAQGAYADGGRLDLTAVSDWRSSDAAVARVSAGRVEFLAPGVVTIVASHPPFEASADVSTIHSGRP